MLVSCVETRSFPIKLLNTCPAMEVASQWIKAATYLTRYDTSTMHELLVTVRNQSLGSSILTRVFSNIRPALRPWWYSCLLQNQEVTTQMQGVAHLQPCTSVTCVRMCLKKRWYDDKQQCCLYSMCAHIFNHCLKCGVQYWVGTVRKITSKEPMAWDVPYLNWVLNCTHKMKLHIRSLCVHGLLWFHTEQNTKFLATSSV